MRSLVKSQENRKNTIYIMDDIKKKFEWDDGSHVFFTSDTHFAHENILKFCQRPWGTVREMDEALVENWNSVVGPDDTIFHLGDFAWGGSGVWMSKLDKLNGHIYLVLGNHDMKNIRQGYMNRFEWVGYQMQIRVEGQPIYLNHFPFLTYGGVWRGKDAVWQLFGHVHSGPYKDTGLDINRLSNLFPTQYDVGVDNNNYKPVSFPEVKTIIYNQMESPGLVMNKK